MSTTSPTPEATRLSIWTERAPRWRRDTRAPPASPPAPRTTISLPSISTPSTSSASAARSAASREANETASMVVLNSLPGGLANATAASITA